LLNRKKRAKGVEPAQNPQQTEEKPRIPTSGAAKASVAVSQPMTADASLQAVVEAWPSLPEAIKAGIIAMVKVAGKDLFTRGGQAP
jgi:hypothetical protein